MSKIVRPGEKLSEKKIRDFEKSYNISLPLSYRNFLIEFNGGSPLPNSFKISEEMGDSVVSTLFSIGDTKSYRQLERNIEIIKGRLPEQVIPIGDDPGGNLLCLGIKDEYQNAIYFWDHENEEAKIDNLHFLEKDLFLFLDKLYEDQGE